MNDQKKLLSRREFLSALGGIGLAVFLAKFSSIKNIKSALKPKEAITAASVAGSYGNHFYGGAKG